MVLATPTNLGGTFLGAFRRARVRALYELVVSVYHVRQITPEEFNTLLEIRARTLGKPRPSTSRKIRRAFWNLVNDPCWLRCYEELRVGAGKAVAA